VSKKNLSLYSIWDALLAVQKSQSDGFFYTVYINRPAGRFLAAGAHVFGLTPNQLTLISFAVTVAGLGFLISVGYQSLTKSIFGVLILLIGFAFDSADGQLARLRGIKSPSGEWLDHVVDSIKIPLCHLSIVFIITQTTPDLKKWVFFYLLCLSVLSSAKFFSLELKRKLLAASAAPIPILGKSTRLVLSLFDYGTFCFIFLLASSSLLITHIFSGEWYLFHIA